LATIRAHDVWQRALEKWADIATHQPDLAPAVALQQRMLRILIDAAEALDDSTVGLPELTGEVIAQKWARGVPAIRGEMAAIPAALRTLPAMLCDVLEESGAGESAAHIKRALSSGEIDAGSLLTVSLARNQKAIRTSALHHGFAPDLIWLVGELASSPLAHLWSARVLGSDPRTVPGSDPNGGWTRGYCPICGSWPALIEMLSGARLLRCSYCAAAWELPERRCVYCANHDERFIIAATDVARTDRLLELCGECGYYTKAIAVAEPAPFPLIAIEDLATMNLDEAAMARKYQRPSLIDLDAIDPPASPGCS